MWRKKYQSRPVYREPSAHRGRPRHGRVRFSGRTFMLPASAAGRPSPVPRAADVQSAAKAVSSAVRLLSPFPASSHPRLRSCSCASESFITCKPALSYGQFRSYLRTIPFLLTCKFAPTYVQTCSYLCASLLLLTRKFAPTYVQVCFCLRTSLLPLVYRRTHK